MRRLVGLVAVTMVLAILLSALPSLAVQHKYIEDFTTTRYKDVLNTTARWDTVAGELKLFPFVPTLVGSCATPSYAYGVTVSGDHAFVADGYSGLQVIDISDPTHPTLTGTYDTPGWAVGVTVSGDHAFVADYTSGLVVIDISDPANPTLAGFYGTPDLAAGVTVSGDHAFVADYGSGLLVIDISDPTNPTLTGTYDTPGNAWDVTVSGDNAFVADGSSGLQVIDISDPTNPTLVGTCETPDVARGVTVSGDNAFVADGSSGLQVIDISDPTNPTLVGTCETPDVARGVTVSGDNAFVADGSSGLQVIDISDPTHPTLAGICATPGIAWDVTVSGDHAFVADYTSGLQVITVGDLMNPSLAGNCPTPFYAYDVAIAGDNAYVADGPLGFLVTDISDPTHPSIVGSCPTTYALAVAIAGDYACVADYDSGLKVIDISDPIHPTVVGTYDTPGTSGDVAISGDYAYVADANLGLQIINISDPTHPTLAGCYGPLNGAYGVAIWGDYACVANGYGGFIVINISNPASPALAGSLYTGGLAYDVTIEGDYAFMADYTLGLQIINISDPTHPTLAGTYNTPGSANGVTISGDRAYVADATSGLQVIDISNPAGPVLAGSYDTPGESRKVVIDGDLAYVADGPSGIQVLQVYQRFVDLAKNRGQSRVINSLHEDMVRARLSASQSDSILWEISANGGTNWGELTLDGTWRSIAVPGSDLIWRSTHRCAKHRTNPACTQLALDWLYNFAVVDSIVDVPNDQGGWVRAHFTRSGRDFPDEATLPITNYGIWRRVDSAALVAALEMHASSAAEKSADGDMPELDGVPVITYQGKTYVQSRPGFTASYFPPGTWEWVGTVPAVQRDTYIAAVPTVADSSASGTNHTVFVLTAHTTTPSIWYVSEPDSGYSVDNIAPAVPAHFAVAYNTGSGNRLSWNPSPDEDFQYFNVYRSSDPNFVPSPSDLVHSLTGTSWSDPDYDGWNVYYKITALDYVGNESDPASPGTVTAVTEPVIPRAYGLYPNVPNPFNPSTSIRYDVPAGGGAVTLRIYDVSGKLIRTLVDGPQAAGQKTATWNGRDDRGRSVASGVYFYRLQAPGYKKTLKMILVQ